MNTLNGTTGKKLAVAAMSGTAVGSAVLAGLAVWLLLTQPMTVATAVTDHDLTPLVQAVVGVLRELMSGLVRYL